ncbi:hypothetical protein [Paenibacillus periandrae]|uniref:hypothetical protein n=1 Tax=Paenibacillus periandrae TaxID=1761741 RepID=UPI001F09DFCD|nr:hypothetical protein [Paenibacillus periandrae]
MTYFITFSGSLVQAILSAMGLHHSNLYQLDTPELFYELFQTFMEDVQLNPELTGAAGSADVYQFFILLKTCGHEANAPALTQRYERLTPLIQWLEEQYGDLGIGLPDMARQLHMSP